jgi:hypothetical protein
MLVNLTIKEGINFLRNHSALTLRVNLEIFPFVKTFSRAFVAGAKEDL